MDGLQANVYKNPICIPRGMGYCLIASLTSIFYFNGRPLLWHQQGIVNNRCSKPRSIAWAKIKLTSLAESPVREATLAMVFSSMTYNVIPQARVAISVFGIVASFIHVDQQTKR